MLIFLIKRRQELKILTGRANWRDSAMEALSVWNTGTGIKGNKGWGSGSIFPELRPDELTHWTLVLGEWRQQY